MDVVTKRTTASRMNEVIKLPKSFSGKKVEVTVKVIEDESAVDKLYGCASNLNVTPEEVREERLGSV